MNSLQMLQYDDSQALEPTYLPTYLPTTYYLPTYLKQSLTTMSRINEKKP